MNERIKELFEKCVYEKEWGFDVEMFAQLVVRECADIAYEVGLHRQTKHEILRRFGLEVTDEKLP